jgi:hypothetical protein
LNKKNLEKRKSEGSHIEEKLRKRGKVIKRLEKQEKRRNLNTKGFRNKEKGGLE